MTQFKTLLISLLLVLQVLGAGSYFKGPGLIEGFTTITSAAGTTTLTKDSETKQILTGSTTQTFVLPDATTLPLGRYFNMINKSSGIMTIQTSGGGALTTVDPGVQKEIHLRAAGSAAGTWDVLAGGGGGVWGSITGTLSAQTDLNTALGLKAPSASPTFTGTIGTPLTASKLLATDASGNLTATAANSSQASYLDLTSSAQTQLNGKLSTSNYSAKGDLVAGVSSGVVSGLSLGGEGSYLLSDPNNITNGIRWGTPAGLTNYVKQSQAEGGITTGWATYADAAGTSPVDGTGGSPNSTFSTTSTNPLRGSNSFTLTLNTGATRQGEGVCYPITIDRADSINPKQQKIDFDYEVSSGTFVAGNPTDLSSAGDSTLTVWVVDTTSGQVIQPSTYRLYSNVSDHYSGYFQNNYNSTSYRVCLHKGTSATVSGSNIVVKVDDVKVAPSTYLAGTTITDWVSYTYTGFTSTNGVVSSKWRRVGDTMEIQQNVEWSGAAGAFSGVFGLPSGYSIDTSKLGLNTLGVDRTLLGRAQFLDSGAFIYDGLVTYRDTTTVTVWQVDASSSTARNAIITATSPFSFAANDTINLKYSVPITGWSSSTQVSDGYDGRLVSAAVYRATSSQTINSASDVKIQWNGKTKDTTSSFDSTTNYRFTAPSYGTYRHSGQITISATASSTIAFANLYKNGTPVKTLGSVITSTSAVTTIPFSIEDNAVASDYYEIYFNSNSVSMNVHSDATIYGGSQWYITKIQAPTTMSATEVVAASYTTAAGQSISNSTTDIIDFGTKDFDTHNAVTTGSSWKFTAPISGLYEVSSTILFASSAVTQGNAIDLQVFKNGTVAKRLGYKTIETTFSNFIGHQGSAMVQLNAGDYIDIRVGFNRTGGNTNLHNSSTYNHVNIKRIK